MTVEYTALEVCVKEIHEIASHAEGMSESVFKGLLKTAILKYYKAHTLEFLEILEAQHNVTEMLGFEGTA